MVKKGQLWINFIISGNRETGEYSKDYKKIVKKMDSILNNWIVQTNDLGEYPESFIINNSLVH